MRKTGRPEGSVQVARREPYYSVYTVGKFVSSDEHRMKLGRKARKCRLPHNFIISSHASLQFHVGEVVSSLRRTTLVPGGAEVLLYSTINGSIGALLPFKSRWVPLGGRASLPATNL